jgi:hypothetical protein
MTSETEGPVVEEETPEAVEVSPPLPGRWQRAEVSPALALIVVGGLVCAIAVATIGETSGWWASASRAWRQYRAPSASDLDSMAREGRTADVLLVFKQHQHDGALSATVQAAAVAIVRHAADTDPARRELDQLVLAGQISEQARRSALRAYVDEGRQPGDAVARCRAALTASGHEVRDLLLELGPDRKCMLDALRSLVERSRSGDARSWMGQFGRVLGADHEGEVRKNLDRYAERDTAWAVASAKVKEEKDAMADLEEADKASFGAELFVIGELSPGKYEVALPGGGWTRSPSDKRAILQTIDTTYESKGWTIVRVTKLMDMPMKVTGGFTQTWPLYVQMTKERVEELRQLPSLRQKLRSSEEQRDQVAREKEQAKQAALAALNRAMGSGGSPDATRSAASTSS